MSLRPYKFIVQAVPQQIDEQGNVVAELAAEPVVLFGCEALATWAADFPDKLAQTEAANDFHPSQAPAVEPD